MIYLDNAATSFPKPEAVYQALDASRGTALANPGRAGHKMALAAEHALDDARHRLNQFFNGKSPERWVFTLNGTDALNMAFKGVLNDGDHVITTDLEHNSVTRPLVALAEAGRITLTRVAGRRAAAPSTPTRSRRRSRRRRGSSPSRTRATCSAPCSRSRRSASCVRERDALFLVDAAQTAGVMPIDVQATCIDLLAFPGHKSLLGPTGTGALYVGPRANLRPWREGGTGGDSSTPTQPKEFPYFLEGGTPNVLGVAGLVAGLDFVEERGLDAIRKHEVELCDQLRTALARCRASRCSAMATRSRRVGTVSFRCEMMPAAELGGILDQSFDIAVRPGLHCAPYIHKSLGSFPDGLVRVSPGPFNTAAEIDTLIEALKEVTGGI